MGDVLTLIEKAQTAVDEKEAAKLAKKMKENSFDMNDLLENLRQVSKMGSIKQILGMLPGMGSKIENMDIDERQFVRIEAMITSMTPAEREKPAIISPSRKRRIAAGSGVKVEVRRHVARDSQSAGLGKLFKFNFHAVLSSFK